MGQTWTQRYQPLQEDRFRALVLRFVGKLPPSGWSGGVAELEAALGRVANPHSDYVPTASALTKAVLFTVAALEEHGWTVRQWRTSQQRGLAFLRLDRDAD